MPSSLQPRSTEERTEQHLVENGGDGKKQREHAEACRRAVVTAELMLRYYEHGGRG